MLHMPLVSFPPTVRSTSAGKKRKECLWTECVCRCSNLGSRLFSQYSTILSALYPLFHGQNLANVTDNAAGAVARLILSRPEAVPLDQVLPTFTTALPLKRDYEENEPVFECIFSLFRANNSFVMAHIPQFLHIFAQVLNEEGQIKDPTKANMIELIRALDAQSPNLNIRSSELAQYL